MADNKNKTLRDARIKMNYLTGDVEARGLAELREKGEMDRINAISHTTKVEKEEGIIEIAKEMLKEKIPEENIKKVTKLSQEE